MTDKGPLKLFWYRREPNFGDAITPLIVAHVARREVVWAGHSACELYALGSLMKMVSKEQDQPRADGTAPHVWGTGAMSPVPAHAFMAHTPIALLRGPITASFLARRETAFGDPGLLMADVLGDPPERQDYVAVVPHMHFVEDEAILAAIASDPRLRLVDVRDPDPLAVVRQIAGAAHVISQSLHGLVVADAFGVANSWLDPMGMPGMGGLKFLDYGAGIDRAMGIPIEVGQISARAAKAATGPLAYSDGIAAAKAALYDRFPSDLRAGKGGVQ